MDINIATLSNVQGFRILGENSNDYSGISVSGVGDVNKDGYADIIVGASNALNGAGKSYVIFGKVSGFSDISLSTLSPTQGFRIIGEAAGDEAGSSVSSAGDVNGDGYDDIIIGAPWATDRTGKSHVIFGKANGSSDINLSSLNPTQGFKVLGENAYDNSGHSVSGAGDINGDGYADVIIGAYGAASQTGKSYVIFGKASGFSDISLSMLTSTQGFRILGEGGKRDGSGSGDTSVSSAGDINGDGYADVVIGANYATNYAGKSYVIFGNSNINNKKIELHRAKTGQKDTIVIEKHTHVDEEIVKHAELENCKNVILNFNPVEGDTIDLSQYGKLSEGSFKTLKHIEALTSKISVSIVKIEGEEGYPVCMYGFDVDEFFDPKSEYNPDGLKIYEVLIQPQ